MSDVETLQSRRSVWVTREPRRVCWLVRPGHSGEGWWFVPSRCCWCCLIERGRELVGAQKAVGRPVEGFASKLEVLFGRQLVARLSDGLARFVDFD